MNNPRFNYCVGNIKAARVRGEVSMGFFLNRIRTPREKTINLIHRIRTATDSQTKDKLKTQLPSVTPAVQFRVGDARKYANIQKDRKSVV
jgi:hypothetical protein